MSNPDRQVECTIPVLPVKDLALSIEFYTATLGFVLDWGGGDGSRICSVSRDEHSIMLSEGLTTGTSPQWVWIGLEDATLFEKWKALGVKVHQEPKNWTWAFEMKFEDIDGNILWVGTEPISDQPYVDGDEG